MTQLLQETTQRLVLRLVLAVAPVLAVLAAGSQARPSGWVLVLVITLSLGFAGWPDSAFGSACLAVVLVWWALASGAAVPAAAMLAAALMLAAHVAALLLSYGPPGLVMDRRTSRLWWRRAAMVGVASPLVWLVAVAVSEQPMAPGIWPVGLAASIAVCVVAVLGLRVPEAA